jgi:hypothetical protein
LPPDVEVAVKELKYISYYFYNTVLIYLFSLFRTGFKNLLICCQDHPRPQEPAEPVLPTKPNHVPASEPKVLVAKQGIVNHGIQNQNGGTDHANPAEHQPSPNHNGQLNEKTTTCAPRTRSAEIHGSKLKEKKRQKQQQQQRWSFTENPSGGSTSSSGPVDGAKMAAESSGHVATVRIIDKWPADCAVGPQPV